MNSHYNIIPLQLLSQGIQLKDKIGVEEIAWRYQDILKVIKTVRENGLPILGGDVYKLTTNSIEIAYDNWYSAINSVEESAEYAINYIINYHESNGDDYVFSIVF